MEPEKKGGKAGDIFVMRIRRSRWLFGRVITTEAVDVPRRLWEPGDPLWTLIYIYQHIAQECIVPEGLSRNNLLVPPIITSEYCWHNGWFRTIEHVPLAPNDVLAVHCFYSPAFLAYFDEKGNTLADRVDPCGDFGIQTIGAIDRMIGAALGLSPQDDAAGDDEFETDENVDCDEDEVILLLPPFADGTKDLSEIEESLIEVLELSGAGEWEGHGWDLETKTWDIRFKGPDPEQIAAVILPMLKNLPLPTGSLLLIGGKSPRRVNLN